MSASDECGAEMGQSVGRDLRRLVILIKRRADGKVGIDDGGVTHLHGWVIEYLAKQGEDGALQSDLERRLSVRRSTISRVLKLMENNGLIERESVEYDARQKRIRCTGKALLMRKTLKREIDETERVMSEGISEEDMAVFIRVVRKMSANLSRDEA